MVGKNEVTVQSTKEYPLHGEVSLVINPEDIHIMNKEFVTNIYNEAWIDDKNRLVIDDIATLVDVTQLVSGGYLDDDGYLFDSKNKRYNLKDADVIADVPFDAIILYDNEEDGTFAGEIVEIIYLGDHSRLTIRTENDEDFVTSTIYNYDLHDRVSLDIDESKIKLKLKGDIAKYES